MAIKTIYNKNKWEIDNLSYSSSTDNIIHECLLWNSTFQLPSFVFTFFCSQCIQFLFTRNIAAITFANTFLRILICCSRNDYFPTNERS